MLLFAIENGMKMESVMPTFSKGLCWLVAALAADDVDGALGVHSNRFDMIRL